ncbi:MAG: UDP-N-acetylmuramate--L-alanine ligase [Chloroflexi bacterium]|nr:UDP-N-acetylmuramate--L-alanine ligase [Chloroflexota bacterium]
MTRTAAQIGAGLEAARAARPITSGSRIHVVGAAGAGASAAAWLAARAGAVVTGCDPGAPSPYTAALDALDVAVADHHDPAHVARDGQALVDRVAVTKALTAVAPDHPELQAAQAAGLRLEAWQQVVADAAASQGGRLIAVAGTHGKSTSAGWLVALLTAAGRDPGAFVGALLAPELTDGPPATARWGRGSAFVVEADEYAGNFDAYRPDIAVLLNAEWDHPDVFLDEDAVLDTFRDWLLAPGAQERVVVANVADRGVARLVERLPVGAMGVRRVVRVGLLDDGDPSSGHTSRPEDGLDLVGRSLPGARLVLDGPALTAAGASGPLEVALALPGRHNAANALCVAAAALEAGLTAEELAAHLGGFRGVGRRMEVKGEPRGVLVLDDYGHHPTAIAATLAAVRETYPGRPVWAVYEPLTYHRTAAMVPAFADVLATADHAVIADIWAGRDPDTTITSAAALAEAIGARTTRTATAPGSVEVTAEHLAARVRPGDVVLVMGGGRSYVIAERLVTLLSEGG